MNSAALHPTERDKEAGGSSLPLHFEHWTRAMAQGLQEGMKSQWVPPRKVVPCVATEQKNLSAHRRLYTHHSTSKKTT